MDTQRLARCLRRYYGIEAGSISRTPGGEIGMAFKVESTDGRWFVKATYPQPWFAQSPDRVAGALRAAAAIRSHVGSAVIVAPVASLDGAPVVEFEGATISVFPFVEATPLGHRRTWPDEVLASLARTVGEVHLASSFVAPPDLQVDGFFLWYARSLEEALAALASITEPSEAQRQTQHTVLAHEEELMRLAGQYREFRSLVMAKPQEMVMNHTDLNASNILRDGSGRLHVVDWDGAALCAPERDISYLVDPLRLEIVRRAYAQSGRDFVVDGETLAFYRQRDALADLTFYIWRAMDPGRTEAQQARDAEAFAGYDWIYEGGFERRTDEYIRLFGRR